ncbi:MAG: hypothetical protein LCH61_02450 [Proteobacteria bacterium]|nr:hypothetical protein [Pseudomonadota bacterium]
MRRNKTFREQHLLRTADIAGTAFGWADGDRDNAAVIADWQARRRLTMLYVPALIMLPFVASMAYYLSA